MPRKVKFPRLERFTLLLTEAERERLDAMAEEAGVDRSTLVRLCVFGGASTLARRADASVSAGPSGSMTMCGHPKRAV
jgi:hypothetical protein